MKISELLRRETLQIAGGVILNYFKIKKRRDTLYFGDIPAEYFLLCEKNGLGKEVQDTARDWMYLYFSVLIPDAFKKIRPERLLNGLVKKIWINMGLMSDFSMKEEGKRVLIETRNEGTSELIGKNSFQVGFYEGILNALYGKESEVTDVKQTKRECSYGFKISEKGFAIEGKKKDEYNKLNQIPRMKGLTLDEMLKRRIFNMDGRKLYFRERVIYPIENTIIHLFSNKGLLLEKVPGISYGFFNGIVEKNAENEDKLRLLKNLMEAMGWGIFTVAEEKERVRMKIENPPYGLQKDKDNWDFLIRMIEGYLRTIDKNYRVEDVNQGYKLLKMGFSR